MPRIKQSVHFSDSSNVQLLNKRRKFFNIDNIILATSITPQQLTSAETSLQSAYDKLLQDMKNTKDEIVKFYKEAKSALDSEYASIMSQMEGVSQLNERRKEYKDDYGLRNICNSDFHKVMDLDELWLSVVEYLDMRTVKSLRLTCFQWNILVEQMAPISFKITTDTLFFFGKFKRYRQLTLPNKASAKCVTKLVDVLSKEEVMKVKIEDMDVNPDVLATALSTAKIQALDISMSNASQLPEKLPNTVQELTIRKHQPNRWNRFDGNFTTSLVKALIKYVDEDGLKLKVLHLNDSQLSPTSFMATVPGNAPVETETNVAEVFTKLNGLTSISFPSRCLKPDALESFFLRNKDLSNIYMNDPEAVGVFMTHLDDFKHLRHVSISASTSSERITKLLQRGVNISIITHGFQQVTTEFWQADQKQDTIKSKSFTIFSVNYLKPATAITLSKIVTNGSPIETLGVRTPWKGFNGLTRLLQLMKEGRTQVKHLIVQILYTRYTFSVKSSFCLFDSVTTIVSSLPESVTTLTIDLERPDTKQTAHIRMTKSEEEQVEYVKKWLELRPKLESINLCTRVGDFDSVNALLKSTIFAIHRPELVEERNAEQDVEEEDDEAMQDAGERDEEAMEDDAAFEDDDADFLVEEEEKPKKRKATKKTATKGGTKRARSPKAASKGKATKKSRKGPTEAPKTTKRITRSSKK